MPVARQTEFGFEARESKRTDSGTVAIDNSFPEKAADDLASMESFNKHLYRPNTYLHKWWARRSGTTFRHILKQLVADPAKRDFYKPGGLEGVVILDPMMGGGTTLHEAIRMGANVIGIDIDPIPVLQAKATLTLSSMAEKRAVFNSFYDTLRQRLASLFETQCPSCEKSAEIQFVLYALRRVCLCREVLLVDNLILRHGREDNILLCPKCMRVHNDAGHNCERADVSILEKGVKRCEMCDGIFSDMLDKPFSDRYAPIVVIGGCRQHGQFFREVNQADTERLNKTRSLTRGIDFGNEEEFSILPGPKSDDLRHRGINSFLDLFTPRQLLFLNHSREFLSRLPDESRLWLSLLVSTSLEFNSLLCGYKGSDIRRPGAIRHVFSHHAYSFPYTALENNPLFPGNTSGTLIRLFRDRVEKATEWAQVPVEIRKTDGKRSKIVIQGEVDGGEPVSSWKSLKKGERKFLLLQADSATVRTPIGIADFVVTDPPYFDSVQYSDLSNFFRVWLHLFLAQQTDWHYNPLDSAVSDGSGSGNRKYGLVMERIWKTCHRALKKDHGRLIFTFHHWNHEAWAELTLSLKHADFELVNRYVVSSENPISVHIRNLKALKHDTILVLKPKSRNGGCKKWPKLRRIESSDSYAFCRDCGTALGWLVASDNDEEAIRAEWKRLIDGDDNDETSG